MEVTKQDMDLANKLLAEFGLALFDKTELARLQADVAFWKAALDEETKANEAVVKELLAADTATHNDALERELELERHKLTESEKVWMATAQTAQSEIARLQALLERREKLLTSCMMQRDSLQAEVERLTLLANGKWQSIDRAEDDRIWNAAIEEAAQTAASIVNGRVYFNQRARCDDQEFISAIRTLIRPTKES